MKTTVSRLGHWLLRYHMLLLPFWWGVVLAGTMILLDTAFPTRMGHVGPGGVGARAVAGVGVGVEVAPWATVGQNAGEA